MADIVQNTQQTSTKKRIYSAGEFSGPLDLLWDLIKENKIDICNIPIALITGQFLDYIDTQEKLQLQDLSEFYMWAAKLILIKSKMLLPPSNFTLEDIDIEDPRADLVETLIEYHKFKKLGDLLETQEEQADFIFERKGKQRIVPYNTDDLWQEVDTDALLLVMQRMYKRLMLAYSDPRVLDLSEDVSVSQKITLMNELFAHSKTNECMFSHLVGKNGGLLDIVCSFLAVLEAVKFKMALIFQNKMFGDIKICKRQTQLMTQEQIQKQVQQDLMTQEQL